LKEHWVKDDDFFYGCVRWIILISAIICAVIMIIIPTGLYLLEPETYTMSRLTTLVINCMGVASLLLAVHSVTESRTSGKEIHDVTEKLEGLMVRHEENILRTMDKLNDLDRGQQQINSMLKGTITKTESMPAGSWTQEEFRTADPSDAPALLQT